MIFFCPQLVFNAILNNISVGVSFIGGGNRSAR
jgi:hypothetical protein